MGELPSLLPQAHALKASIALSSVIAETEYLVKRGTEFRCRCPFHNEKSPSFTIVDTKGWAHCFGCGWHGDLFQWLEQKRGMRLHEAIRYLGGERQVHLAPRPVMPAEATPEWAPILPVPVTAPRINRWTRFENPKSGKQPRLEPVAMHSYRAAGGALLGYVFRCMIDGKKWTPTITYCRHQDGRQAWCLQPFPKPRPLYGLDRLAWRPYSQVILVEGEKTADAARVLFPKCVVVTWPGGVGGVAHVDWSPLDGRDVITIEDADEPGARAMAAVTGLLDASSVRRCRPHADAPAGWDLADAVGWTTSDAAAWVRRGLA